MNATSIGFESYGISHTGCVRELNEDRYLMQPQSGLWLVADGMGGHDAGEIASQSIVAHMATLGVATSAPDLRARFEHRIGLANDEIWRISQERGGGTIGSTMVALLAYDRHFACLWTGDSRIYLLRDGQLSQVSRDHTEVQELVDQGVLTEAEAKTWPRRNVITRAVGVTEELVADIQTGRAEPGDVFVLNSDGLTAHVSDVEIQSAVAENAPEEACRLLIDTVLSRGGTDNVTVVIVKCHESAEDESDHTIVPGPGLGLNHVG